MLIVCKRVACLQECSLLNYLTLYHFLNFLRLIITRTRATIIALPAVGLFRKNHRLSMNLYFVTCKRILLPHSGK